MKLSEIVERIHKARAAHKAWVTRAEALVAGLPLDRELVPVLPTDCEFGRWYYGPGQMLRRLPAYREIEPAHDALHKTYMRIFQLLYDEPDVSRLGRLFGQARRQRRDRLQQAQELLPVLRKQSEEMGAILDALEEQLLRAARKRAGGDGTIDRTLE